MGESNQFNEKSIIMRTLTLMMVICLGGLNCQRNFRLPDQPRRLELPANLNRELPANFNRENPLATPGIANAPAQAEAQQCAFGSVCFGNWRLIMCNGRWRWVTKNTCPAVFHDHDFSQHQNCDNPLTSLASYYSGSHNVKHLSLSPFGLHTCRWMPCCFCPACCRNGVTGIARQILG